MPTYDFKCPSCSSKFEKRRSFSDTSPVACPECGAEAEQQFSPVPIIFKGSGFYVTDHRTGSHGHSAPADSSSDSGSESDSGKEAPKADKAAETSKE